ncbi:MAG: cobalt ECF transporter T component CbiQ [Solirubrobacterales bacterium]
MSSHSLALVAPAGDAGSPVHELDPRAKIVGLVAIVLIAVTTPLSAWPVYVACLALLAAVAMVGRVPPAEAWRRLRFLLPVVLLAAVFLPFARPGGVAHAVGPLNVHQAGLETAAAAVAKATIGTLAAVMLAATTGFPQVLRGLEAMRAPRLLVTIAAFMYRYLFVIAEELGRMRAALVSRGYDPRNALHAAALGRVATASFLRTHARGERVYRAMLARGYAGSMPRGRPLALGWADAAFVVLVLAALVPLRVAAGVAG